MMTLDAAWIRAELAAIRASKRPEIKGPRLETLIRTIFLAIPGMDLEDIDVKSAYLTEEIDIYFWNDREREGLHFLDCPLLVECKGWSKPVSGRELRYFATTLKDKGRVSGVFVARRYYGERRRADGRIFPRGDRHGQWADCAGDHR
jgi:hypothetical protein